MFNYVVICNLYVDNVVIYKYLSYTFYIYLILYTYFYLLIITYYLLLIKLI